MILEKGCAERGCACYDVRVDEGVECKRMRELTDEEIEKTWHELYPLDSNNYWEDMRRGFCQLRFARAILKKASERA